MSSALFWSTTYLLMDDFSADADIISFNLVTNSCFCPNGKMLKNVIREAGALGVFLVF